MRAAAKWLLPVVVAVFPYSPWVFVEVLERDPWRAVFWFWLAGLAAAVLLILTRKAWTARQLVKTGVLVKLFQIPAYVIWFAVGMLMFLFMGPLLAFVVDTMTIILSGLLGLAAVLQCRKEGILTGRDAMIHGVLQFVFCADVVSAIILYRKTKEVSL